MLFFVCSKATESIAAENSVWVYLKADSHDLHLTHAAHSHNLRLTHAAVADGCVSTEIGNFLFFRTAHLCRICSCL